MRGATLRGAGRPPVSVRPQSRGWMAPGRTRDRDPRRLGARGRPCSHQGPARHVGPRGRRHRRRLAAQRAPLSTSRQGPTAAPRTPRRRESGPRAPRSPNPGLSPSPLALAGSPQVAGLHAGACSKSKGLPAGDPAADRNQRASLGDLTSEAFLGGAQPRPPGSSR